MTCVIKTHFFPIRGKKRFLDSKESQPEEESSGLLSEMGSPRAKPGSTLSKWGVAWVRRIPLVRYAVLLTGIVPRTSPRLAGRLTSQRRERSEAFRGRMYDKGIVVLTGQKSCPISAREKFRH